MLFTKQIPQIKHQLPSFCGALILSLSAQMSVADDIEIYLQEPPDPVPPNVLFVLDESGSMSSGSPSRRDQLVDAMTAVVNNPDLANTNAALLGYTTRWGNNGPLYMRAHSGEFKLFDGNESSFTSQVTSLQTISYTPTVKAMEAAVDWFRRDRTFTDYFGNSMTSPIDGDPEDNWCRPNHIVLLSDGAPNSNSPTSGQAYGLTSYEGTNCVRNSTSRYTNGRCAREIARWAYTTDLEEGTGWHETQNITTHTIGFDTSTGSSTEIFLQSLVGDSAGGGNYYQVDSDAPANSVAGLSSVLTSIIVDAQESIPYAYTAPVIPFNPDNAAISGDRIYIPLFVPSTTTFWKGNLKSYSFAVSDGNIVILDELGSSVVNEAYEFTGSQDYWNDSSDGGETLEGGAASHMGAHGVRNLYTNLNGSAPLSDSTNRVIFSNTAITNAMMGVATDEERVDLLNWITWDPTWTINNLDEEPHTGVMGAPIHTQPAVVNYAGGDVVLLPTSEGVLTAIDADTGAELWAFMPVEFLSEISTIKTNNPSTTPFYGLDGPLTVYEVGGSKMAIVGMRRGGKKYFLLDVTDRDAPVFVREISAASDVNFTGLAQTWSKPLFVNINIGGAATPVLIFGGGYDTDQDTTTSRSSDDEGNYIFIVNAADGGLLRTVSNTGADITVANMTNSIASDVMTIDIDGDAMVDRIYAADVGGRIIRVDVDAMTGAVIADVNSSGGFRRFFNTPQAGYYSKGGIQFVAILIGSGNRTDPLDGSTIDRFYMIKDRAVWNPPTSYTTVTQSMLINTTSTAATRSDILNPANGGWYFDLSNTEKSYSKAILYNYAVIFTTFSATRADDLGDCEARGSAGTARVYAVDMIDANAKFNWNGGSEDSLTVNDRSDTLNMLGIPPSPMLVFPGDLDDQGGQILGNKVHLLVGIEKKRDWDDYFLPTYWEEVIDD
ncbi:MAG: VWA domain-containing protein [Candidatus Thiodiazotropha sp. 'RUGA']|nr:VWA domain-containing protein [Candidatus Thiodiazotropha sp. 'RUGA']